MNKIIKGLFYLSVVMLLVSCATTRFEPKNDGSSSLVVGRLTAKASGFYGGESWVCVVLS